VEKKRRSPISCLHIVYVFAIVLIIYVQFQNILGVPLKDSMPQLSHVIFLADKLVIMALFLLAVSTRILLGYSGGRGEEDLETRYLPLLKSEVILIAFLFIFVTWCLLSAAVNQNNLSISLRGIFAYVIYFLVFFVFSSFFWSAKTIQRTYALLLRVALGLSAVSICQEIMALLYPHSVEWWPNIQTGEAIWRMGIFRAPSLLGHPNSIGVFALFFLTIELARGREEGVKNNVALFILTAAILFSMSRAAIGGSILALFLLSRRTRRMAIVTAFGFGFFVFMIGVPSSISTAFSKKPEANSSAQVLCYDKYRHFARTISLDIIRDHSVFGVGPGMYGGHISLEYDSPIYQEYGFGGQYYEYLHDRVGSIEQELLQVLAEVGVPGFICFSLVICAPFVILSRIARRTDNAANRAMIAGLKVMPFLMLFYMFGYTVSQMQEWLIPYFTFVGMLSGEQRRITRLVQVKN
jgi:O-antigen ligase